MEEKKNTTGGIESTKLAVGNAALYRMVRKEFLIKRYLNRDNKEMRGRQEGIWGSISQEVREQVQRFRSIKYA